MERLVPGVLNRREFMLRTSAVSVAAALPMALPAWSQPRSPVAQGMPQAPVLQLPTHDTLLKFNPDTTPREFKGNTVICHLPIQCATRDAMFALHEELLAAPYRHKLGLTAPESYHMTVFPGANDQDRQVTGWPSYVPLDASIETCNRMVGERMAELRLDCELPFRVRVNLDATLHYSLACTMRLVPADAAENTKLRSVRDRLATTYGFRTSDHDSYEFHMTMSYQLKSFTASEEAAYRKLLKSYVPRIIAAAPVIEFGVPEYCTFPSMNRFDTQRLLRCS